MKNFIKKYSEFVISKPLIVLFAIFLVLVIASAGITNFKLDASSDALVLEGDAALKKYRENEEEFGDSSFLIVTFEPVNELFSQESLATLAELEESLSLIDGVVSVLSLMDAPIFFQAEDGIRDSSTSRGLGDVYKRQYYDCFKMSF